MVHSDRLGMGSFPGLPWRHCLPWSSSHGWSRAACPWALLGWSGVGEEVQRDASAPHTTGSRWSLCPFSLGNKRLRKDFLVTGALSATNQSERVSGRGAGKEGQS